MLSLDRGDRTLAIHALTLVVLNRVALWVLPFRIVHRAVAARASRSACAKRNSVERVIWAIEAASRRVPRATCLTQAFAAAVLLSTNGHAATLRVGVAKNDDGSLRAHAWIECEGRAVLGDPRTEAFVALPPLALGG